MRKSCLLTVALLFVLGTAGAAEPALPPLEPVSSVDLESYSGRWYEVARSYNRWQKNCAGEVLVHYSLRADGRIDVFNQCTQADGDVRAVNGVARNSGDAPDSMLEVRFAPAWLSFLPAVWGDYWIIDLAADYSWAAVGEPGRKYFWILSRAPRLDEEVLQGIVTRAEAQGYDLSELIRTRQDRYPDTGKGPALSDAGSAADSASLD